MNLLISQYFRTTRSIMFFIMVSSMSAACKNNITHSELPTQTMSPSIIIDAPSSVTKVTFRDNGDSVDVLSDDGSPIFSYIVSQIVDLDNPSGPTFYNGADRDSNISLINAAIAGAINNGEYASNLRYIASGAFSKEISAARIAKPVMIKNAHEQEGDFCLVPVLFNDRIVAAALLQEVPTTGSWEFVAETKASRPIKDLPKFNEMAAFTKGSLNSLTHGHSSYNIQQFAHGNPERVFLKTNVLNSSVLGFFMWRNKKYSPNYFISAAGVAYQTAPGYSTQALSEVLPANAYLKLVML